MPFTVGIPGGTKDFEYEAVVRLLDSQGINVANLPRVVDPTTRNRWLYAWENRADAERFAAELREETESPTWQVYELDGPSSEGPLGPVEVLVRRQSDGSTYSLSPVSRTLIRKKFPHAKLVPSVFISSETQNGFETAQGPIWGQVAIILTGLSADKLHEVGDYRVYEPATKRVLQEAPAFAT